MALILARGPTHVEASSAARGRNAGRGSDRSSSEDRPATEEEDAEKRHGEPARPRDREEPIGILAPVVGSRRARGRPSVAEDAEDDEHEARELRERRGGGL